jgi:hypothetical protein
MRVKDGTMKAKLGTICDYSGIALSWACMVHCVLLPFAIPVLPALEIFAEDHTHQYLALVILFVGAIAFQRGYQKHHNKIVFLLGLLGIALLFFALRIPVETVLESSSSHGHSHEHNEASLLFLSRESLVTIFGSIILVYAHIQNIRLSRRSCCGGRHGDKQCPEDSSHSLPAANNIANPV